MKKVLIIAHEFAPIGGGRVMRALKFAKYLPEFGWAPVVLSAQPEDCFYSHEWLLEPELLREVIGKIRLYQIPSPLERLAKRLRRALQRPERQADQSLSGLSMQVSYFNGGWRHCLAGLRAPQDLSALWNPYAYAAAVRLIRQENITAVLTTSPPHLLQVVGYWIKRRARLPWIADFRDGWRGNPLFQAGSPARQRLDNRLEHMVVNSADAKLVVTEHLLESFQRTYPSQAGSFYLLHNGFDPADFPYSPPHTPDEELSFVHIGSLSDYRNPLPLLRAFQELIRRGCLPPEKVRITLIGKSFHTLDGQFPGLRVETIPPIPHAEAIRIMQRAGILLLITGIQEGEAAFTSKVFEYLAARRPVLALIPPHGELAQFLASYPLGLVAAPDDERQIQAAILKAIQVAETAAPQPGFDDLSLQQFDRRQQTHTLAGLLDRVSGLKG